MSHSLFTAANLATGWMVCGTLLLPAQSIPGESPTSIPPMLELPHAKLPPPHISTDAPWPWWYYLVGAVVIVLLLWLLSLLVQGFKDDGQKAQPLPIVTARKALNQLQLEAENLEMEELSHRVSTIIRAYQHEKYLIPFHCQTMEEIYLLSNQERFERAKPIFQPLAERIEYISFSQNRESIDRKIQLIEDARQALESDAKLPPV